MITVRSLTNRKRRLPELRRVRSRIQSLKWPNYARRVWSKRLGDDLAIVNLFKHTEEFLLCSFQSSQDSNPLVEKEKMRMIRALRRLSASCLQNSLKNRRVDSPTIKQFGAATTRFYRATRKHPVIEECDECWRLIGLCYHATFA
jgi:hypothetical protein